MTALTVIGTVAGLLVFVLGAVAPLLVDLNDRFPVKPKPAPRPAPAAWGRAAVPTH
ncbi:hypothetical protein [Amycolatopsis sp. FDAARGOS 1241]|uniref:hypothetical protein n=1 Tax=Amycolatopsis sp. FDAARGOS 1241 TaxID=2778070 RepID=UPI0019526FDF|nr:hypothetical protein [Amycolatopsis sp. FDAARGOS 1241]QRP47045.1 hypothetical protein I6J71_03175 [Amycolatopsis sp. FDAARGOS 1241]